LQFVDIQLILALNRDEHPRLPRMEIEVPGPKTRPLPGAIDAWFVSTPSLKPKTLSAPGSSGLPSPGLSEPWAYYLVELPQRCEVLVRKHQAAAAGFDNDMRGA
jgi:hypothetical protein